MDYKSLIRPRWGTFSVIDHKNIAALIPEILLYDRLVFPTPTDEVDRARWKSEQWDPDLLDKRIEELGDLAIPTPWTMELREEWSKRWERIKRLGLDTKGLAMGLTPFILSLKAWENRFPPPIMIAAYQNSSAARADFDLIENRDEARGDRKALQRQLGILFERRLEMPIIDNPQQAYEKAIELAHDPNYQNARRSLFEWEDHMIMANWPIQAAIKDLEQRVDAHDDLIKRSFRQTWKRKVFRLVQYFLPKGVQLATATFAGPFPGWVTEGLLKVVEARFPSLTSDPIEPNDDPGAALYQAISVMYHDPN